VLAITLAQGAIGYVQHFTGLPIALVAGHILGATLLWVAVLRLRFSMRERGSEPDDLPAVPAAGEVSRSASR
jgi:cytochrome c oxidase assembly protein subunit 15